MPDNHSHELNALGFLGLRGPRQLHLSSNGGLIPQLLLPPQRRPKRSQGTPFWPPSGQQLQRGAQLKHRRRVVPVRIRRPAESDAEPTQ